MWSCTTLSDKTERSEISPDKVPFLVQYYYGYNAKCAVKNVEHRLDSLGCLRLVKLVLKDTLNSFTNLNSAVSQIVTGPILPQKQHRSCVSQVIKLNWRNCTPAESYLIDLMSILLNKFSNNESLTIVCLPDVNIVKARMLNIAWYCKVSNLIK